jgi:hypothetical protein
MPAARRICSTLPRCAKPWHRVILIAETEYRTLKTEN